MPDLSTEYYYQCKSSEHFSTEVTGSKGQAYTVSYGYTPFGPYQYDWDCTCQGFKFRKSCKHVELAKKLWCGWYQFTDGGEPVNDKCPNCGGEITSRGHGV